MFNGGRRAGRPTSETVITSSTFAGNTAIAGGGGGIWSDHEGALTLVDVDVSGNFADDHGGGLAVVSKASLTMTGSIVRGNIAERRRRRSTATEGAVQFSGVTFSGNEAGVAIVGELGGGNGGALSSSGGPLEIVDSEFAGNYAPDEGGALYLDNGGSVGITDTVVATTALPREAAASRTPRCKSRWRASWSPGTKPLSTAVESRVRQRCVTIIDTTVSGTPPRTAAGSPTPPIATRTSRGPFLGQPGDCQQRRGRPGGGIYSLGDADATYENITITGNPAARGGGFDVDANAGVRVHQLDHRWEHSACRQRVRRASAPSNSRSSRAPRSSSATPSSPVICPSPIARSPSDPRAAAAGRRFVLLHRPERPDEQRPRPRATSPTTVARR